MRGKPIPKGFHSVTPYLLVPGVARLLEFLARAFDAKERLRLSRPDGSIGHAEVQIGDSMIMMGEPPDGWAPMPASIYLYVDDCDAAYHRALGAGGTSVMEPMDMHYAGQRYGGVKDPCGNIWWPAVHLEDLTAEEAQKRIHAPPKK